MVHLLQIQILFSFFKNENFRDAGPVNILFKKSLRIILNKTDMVEDTSDQS